MKKRLVISVLMLVLILSLAACSNTSVKGTPPANPGEVLSGKIAKLYDGSCLIAGSGPSELYTVSTKLDILDADNQATDASALKAGQSVEIGYSGIVMESYPAQLGQPAYIKITGQGDDLIGFYQSVLDDLWHVDEGLNPTAGVLAFDLSKLTNLTAAEKGALVYVVSNAYGLTGVTGTFDELSEQGYIDKENLLFENGMLFQFTAADVSDDSFTFDVSKWRSGTGAYFLNDCKAVKNGADWRYTVGSQAIS